MKLIFAKNCKLDNELGKLFDIKRFQNVMYHEQIELFKASLTDKQVLELFNDVHIRARLARHCELYFGDKRTFGQLINNLRANNLTDTQIARWVIEIAYRHQLRYAA